MNLEEVGHEARQDDGISERLLGLLEPCHVSELHLVLLANADHHLLDAAD